MALKVALATFVAGTDTGSEVVHKGTSYDETDPIVVAFPAAFGSPDEFAESHLKRRVTFGVEAATAAPGEKRNVKKPAAAK